MSKVSLTFLQDPHVKEVVQENHKSRIFFLISDFIDDIFHCYFLQFKKKMNTDLKFCSCDWKGIQCPSYWHQNYENQMISLRDLRQQCYKFVLWYWVLNFRAPFKNTYPCLSISGCIILHFFPFDLSMIFNHKQGTIPGLHSL